MKELNFPLCFVAKKVDMRRELKLMISDFRKFQIVRFQRLRQNKTKMTTFENVRVQLGAGNDIFSANVAITLGIGISIVPIDLNDRQRRDIIVKEEIESFDNQVLDTVTINLFDRARPDPLIMFSTPEEQLRFVIVLRHHMELNNPEQNAGQQQTEEDSGREIV